MSPRSIRRAAERKALKQQRKQERLARTQPDALPLDEEFSPEFIAEAKAARERIHAQLSAFQASRESHSSADDAPAASKSRAEINRANAQLSTGPSTPEGKLASSRNSLKHGLASGTLIIPGEDQAALEALQTALLDEHQPATDTETLLVTEMAQSWWLTQRAIRLQNTCFAGAGVDEKRLALFLRYQTTHERAFHKALATLIRLQKERRKGHSGFVSQKGRRSVAESGFVSRKRPSPVPEPGFVSQNGTQTGIASAPAPS